MEVKSLCTFDDIQTIKIGEPIEYYGDSAAARDPSCDVKEIQAEDCIEEVTPFTASAWPRGSNPIVDLMYVTA